ncbi:hypothetical protein OTB20_08580 [Streptomyces sp. H27-H1]|uniref:hypothetical protein n=1 Tax=Streptomyces sp. H27-H1 TaxID=2996461 RepID=UPI002271C8AE|nr:hypothetical protein [Streptomyces sp. H27-H1]MCY0926261.1 hypothetical protein [Streptomyces sp. H27-H1]
MRKAVIEFTATLEVKEDGDEWEGGNLSPSNAQGWASACLERGDKHAWNYTAYGVSVSSVTYEDVEEEE